MSNWKEVHLRRGADLRATYEELFLLHRDEIGPGLHHFWDEPWNPGAFVIRVQGVPMQDLAALPGVKTVLPWEGEQADRDLYGDWFDPAMRFFSASSEMALAPPLAGKMVHCYLNQSQFSWWDEVWFHLREARDRIRLIIVWKVRGWRDAATLTRSDTKDGGS